MVQASAIKVSHLKTMLGSSCIHSDLNFDVHQGEIAAIAGGSGSGKTTLLRAILMLQPMAAGQIKLFGYDIQTADDITLDSIRQRWGVMFQRGALFSALSVFENLLFPLKTFKASIPLQAMRDRAKQVLESVGLTRDTANKYPSELSGGMVKRVALARALVLRPELLFLDEPTSGLDPKGADDIDDLILGLHKQFGMTIVMVSHDLDSLWRVPHRVAFLGAKKVLAQLPMAELVRSEQPLIKNYFSGVRGALKRGSG